MDGKPKHIQEEDYDKEEEEDTLSLRNFHINSKECDRMIRDSSAKNIQETRRSLSEPSDFFEFFHDLNYEMSHAEDIIFHGTLVPYRNKQLPFNDQIIRSKTGAASARLMRSHTTLDTAKKPRHNPRQVNVMKSEVASAARDQAGFLKSPVKSGRSLGLKARAKPRWYALMFGVVKLGQEIDLQDLKNRQGRRDVRYEGRRNNGKSNGRRMSWMRHDLLRVLSCKSHASVAVGASFALVPQV